MIGKNLLSVCVCATVLLANLAESHNFGYTSGVVLLGFDETLCHPKPTDDFAQYIIGYGTLISDDKKNSIYPEVGESIPVRVSGFGRHWNYRKPTIGFGATHLGAVIDPTATFNGVAFTVPSGDNLTETLETLDKNQPSFCRQRVPIKSINGLVAVNNTVDEGDYWTYVTRSEFSALPTLKSPIVQSNIDVFIAGCLDVGKKHELPNFAAECVESTLGWEMAWVNDRVFPRRPSVQQPRAKEIDQLLAQKTPLAFSRITIEG